MAPTQGFNVFIADDPISLIGLASMFEGRVYGTASDGLEALERLLEPPGPTVALISACLPGATGAQIVRRLHESQAAPKPIIVSCACHSIDFVEAVSNGLMGFVTKNSIDGVKDAVFKVANGETVLHEVHARLIGSLRENNQPCKLTSREHEILVHMAEGLTTKQIAAEIFIAEPTIKFHIRNIYSKLDVHNKGAAVHEAMRQGLID